MILITTVILRLQNELFHIFYEERHSLRTVLLYLALTLFIATDYYYKRKIKNIEFVQCDNFNTKKLYRYSLKKFVLYLIIYSLLLLRFVISQVKIDLLTTFIPFTLIIFDLWKTLQKDNN